MNKYLKLSVAVLILKTHLKAFGFTHKLKLKTSARLWQYLFVWENNIQLTAYEVTHV